MLCPYCQQDAPLIYRGITAYCTACGRQRALLSSTSVSFAGKPAHVGGIVVRTFGYLGLTFGVGFALFVGLFVGLVASATAGLITGGVLTALTLIFALPMLFGGKKLEASGDHERDQQRVQAVFALAANRGGVLRARDAAAALDMPIDAADTFLTELAKRRYDEMNVDVSESGEVVYTFPRLLTVEPSRWGSVFSPGAPAPRVRVEAPSERPAAAVKPVSSAPPPIIDADFEEIEEPSAGARRRV